MNTNQLQNGHFTVSGTNNPIELSILKNVLTKAFPDDTTTPTGKSYAYGSYSINTSRKIVWRGYSREEVERLNLAVVNPSAVNIH
jgi:hypothetical protein